MENHRTSEPESTAEGSVCGSIAGRGTPDGSAVEGRSGWIAVRGTPDGSVFEGRRGLIDDGQIRMLMRDAEIGGRSDIARMCWAALSEGQADKKRRAFGKIERLATRWMSDAMKDLPARSAMAQAGSGEMGFDARFPDDSLAVRVMLDRGDRDEETTENRPLVLALVEFPCPMCHQPIQAADDRGTLRMPWHAAQAAIFPFGLGGPAHRMECPGSLMEIRQVCDGDHRIPSCSDPQCWHEDLEPRPDSESFRVGMRGGRR